MTILSVGNVMPHKGVHHLIAAAEVLAGRTRDFRVHVVGSAGRTYRIWRGVAGNVRELDAAGRERARLCCHPTEDVPQGDVMAAQKLHLETDEAGFRRTANVTPVWAA